MLSLRKIVRNLMEMKSACATCMQSECYAYTLRPRASMDQNPQYDPDYSRGLRKAGYMIMPLSLSTMRHYSLINMCYCYHLILTFES